MRFEGRHEKFFVLSYKEEEEDFAESWSIKLVTGPTVMHNSPFLLPQ